jgi:hypothetical protein
MLNSTGQDSLAFCSMRRTTTFGKRKGFSGFESYKGGRFATSTGSGKSVFVFALMSIDFDYG